MSTPIKYLTEIDPLTDMQAAIPVHQWFVVEHLEGGWSGFADVDPGPSTTISAGEAFGTTLAFCLMPGAPAALGLWVVAQGTVQDEAGDPINQGQPSSLQDSVPDAGEEEKQSATDTTAIPLRTWPSMITNVQTIPSPDGLHDTACRIRFRDPLRALRNTPIWGVFRDCSPGEMLGGALSLAKGGDGKPTPLPTLSGMPPIAISQKLRPALAEVPYAIATGEPLGLWIARVFGRLGVRIEVIGDPSGSVHINLYDYESTRAPLSMNLAPGAISASNAKISGTGAFPRSPERGSILDNPTSGISRRLGESGAVESLFYSAETGIDEGALRAGFERERSLLGCMRTQITTAQPGLHPGRIVEFTNRAVAGATTWQVASVKHGVGDGAYRNTATLMKAGAAWRPAVPRDEGPITVSGVVDDGESPLGETVRRDRLGRIPVTFSFMPTPVDNANVPAPPIPLALPMIEPMAGGKHGFVPAHRQGDVCRVAVQNPLYAEVVGFVYGDDRRIGEEAEDATTGIIMRHDDQQWSGLVFRPADSTAEETDDNATT